MSKFDLENKTSATADYPESDSLQRALSALPTFAPTQDRLENVLRALAAKRELADTRSAKLPPRSTLRTYKSRLVIAVAACFMISVTALLLRPSASRDAIVVQAAKQTQQPNFDPDSSSDIAQLIVISQQLEAGLRDLGESSASFRQLYGRKQAELSLATLDGQLVEVMASNSGQAINKQRALWRERVAVLSAVENGNYRQALFVVD